MGIGFFYFRPRTSPGELLLPQRSESDPPLNRPKQLRAKTAVSRFGSRSTFACTARALRFEQNLESEYCKTSCGHR